MAQRMLDERVRHQELPEPPKANDRQHLLGGEEEDIDGESLGSQDTYSLVSEDSYTEMPLEEDEELENTETSLNETLSRPSLRAPPTTSRRPKRPRKSSPEPPALTTDNATDLILSPKKAKKPTRQARPAAAAAPKRRGNYRSWARYRVAICQALRDAVFDTRKASEIMKKAHKLYVPASVLGYYARKLSRSDSYQSLLNLSF
ncbi:22kDa protein [Aviadenovirus bubonis]|nr:22kDa protein [Owl adenovirus]